MDPNPLQYQAPDDNQPLYRAAGLTAGVMTLVLIVGFGISYTLKHSESLHTPEKRMASTSPDDVIGGLNSNIGSSGLNTFGNSSVSTPNLTSWGVEDTSTSFNPQAQPNYQTTGSNRGAMIYRGPDGFSYDAQGSGTTQGTVVHTSQIRDFASLDPASLGSLIRGE